MVKELLLVALSSVVSLIVLFLLTKLMGHKQVSQLNLFDYIIGISIGSIAAEMASEIEEPEKPLAAMIIYGIAAVLISLIEMRSVKARRIITGTPEVLMRGGTVYKNALKKAKLTVNELLMSARCQGYFDISEIELALLEQNGTISFMPKSSSRPLTPDDMNISPPQSFLGYDVIIDGVIMKDNLKKCGRDEKWLTAELKKQGYGNERDVFLGVFDSKGNLSLFKGK